MWPRQLLLLVNRLRHMRQMSSQVSNTCETDRGFDGCVVSFLVSGIDSLKNSLIGGMMATPSTKLSDMQLFNASWTGGCIMPSCLMLSETIIVSKDYTSSIISSSFMVSWLFAVNSGFAWDFQAFKCLKLVLIASPMHLECALDKLLRQLRVLFNRSIFFYYIMSSCV